MEIVRWRHYGKDRLYVKEADGRDIGWWDLVDAAGHPASAEDESTLHAAVQSWYESQKGGEAVAVPNPAPFAAVHRPSVTATATEWSAAPMRDPSMSHSVIPFGPEYVPAPDAWRTAAPPTGPPVIPEDVDLLANGPGMQLLGKVAEAHAAGQRPTWWRRFRLGKAAYSTWELGLIGEQRVAGELATLAAQDPRWGFLNSIRVGEQTDIDMFVAGPGGVFTINAKYHKGARIWVGGNTVMVNGARAPYVRNSRHEARKAARLLSSAAGMPVAVEGMVVPVGAQSFTIKEQPADVHLVPGGSLTRYLRSRPDVLEPAAVVHIFNVARRASTWFQGS